MRATQAIVYEDNQGHQHFTAHECACADALLVINAHDYRIRIASAFGPFFKDFIEAYNRSMSQLAQTDNKTPLKP